MDLQKVWNTVSDWLTGSVTKDLTSTIQLTPEDIQTQELGGREFVTDEGLLTFEQQPEVPSTKQYRPDELQQPRVTSIVFDFKNDNSLPCLEYLVSLGYTTGMWLLNEQTHVERDICDDYHGLTLDLRALLSSSQRQAPIFTQSHPGCKCYILCQPPSSAAEIPDTAPGLPLYGTPEEIQQRKELLYANFFAIPIYADSVLNTSITQTVAHLKTKNRIKVGKASFTDVDWKKFIIPVMLPFDIIVSYSNFLQQPLFEGSVGFLVNVYRDSGLGFVYFSNRNSLFPIHTFYLQEIKNFSKANISDLQPNMFVLVEDEIGIIHRISGDDIYCYLPRPNLFIITHVDLVTPLRHEI